MKYFFYGAASGTARKVVGEYPEKIDLMVNYASLLNKPLKNTRKLFVDSGGFSFFFKGGVYDDMDKYLAFVDELKPDFFATRDFPCEPILCEKRGVTVRDNQNKTLDNSVEILDSISSNLRKRFVFVVQGWEVDDYLWMIDRADEIGLMSGLVAIGSVCRRNQDQEIRNVVVSIREHIPKKVRLHAFGVKSGVLRFKDVFDALYSADSNAYDFVLGLNLKGGMERYRRVAFRFNNFKKKIDYYFRIHSEQRTLGNFVTSIPPAPEGDL